MGKIINNIEKFEGGYRIVQNSVGFSVIKTAPKLTNSYKSLGSRVIAKGKNYRELAKRFKKKGDVFLNF